MSNKTINIKNLRGFKINLEIKSSLCNEEINYNSFADNEERFILITEDIKKRLTTLNKDNALNSLCMTILVFDDLWTEFDVKRWTCEYNADWKLTLQHRPFNGYEYPIEQTTMYEEGKKLIKDLTRDLKVIHSDCIAKKNMILEYLEAL